MGVLLRHGFGLTAGPREAFSSQLKAFRFYGIFISTSPLRVGLHGLYKIIDIFIFDWHSPLLIGTLLFLSDRMRRLN